MITKEQIRAKCTLNGAERASFEKSVEDIAEAYLTAFTITRLLGQLTDTMTEARAIVVVGGALAAIMAASIASAVEGPPELQAVVRNQIDLFQQVLDSVELKEEV